MKLFWILLLASFSAIAADLSPTRSGLTVQPTQMGFSGATLTIYQPKITNAVMVGATTNAGHIRFDEDGFWDIGVVGAARPKNLYMTGTLVANDLAISKTVTPAGTTGNATMNTACGSVNIAPGQSEVIVTNQLVSDQTVIIATVASNDEALTSVKCIATAGSIRIIGNAPAAAETRVNFLIVN
jgi:hypothetical protein